jgi:hypothetical protein
MLKIFSRLTVFCSFFLFTIIILFFSSCKKHDNTFQIRRIDTLISWNNNAQAMLIIDEQAIRQRVDSMKIKIKAFDSNTIRLNGNQLKSDLVLFNGLLLRYNDFLENYSDVVFENSSNSKYLADLKKQILDQHVKNTSLDSILNWQEKIIRSHLYHTREIVEALFSVEEMYQRLNNRINSVYDLINRRKLE